MRSVFAACSILLATGGPAVAQSQAPDPAPSAAPAAQSPIYELRIYYPASGKASALNARFRNHTLSLFEKHGMRNIAYWNEVPTAEAPDGRVVYVLAYPDRAARDRSWRAFGEDPEWRAVVAESEAGGRLVTKVDSIFMTQADYSPTILTPPAAGGG
jgi:hypothetical protein